jgi:hypothetical protein
LIYGKPEDIANEVIRLWEQESGRRGVWESHWQEIKDRVYPGTTDFTRVSTPGRKQNQEIFDATAATALNRFAAILDSLLTPRNSTWHRVMSSIDELNKDRAVRIYYEDVTRILFRYRYATVANFASQNMMFNKSLGAFGTASMFTDQAASEPGLRYKNCHLGETYFMENHQGLIDQVIRYFPMTAKQALQKWGPKCPEKIQKTAALSPGQEFFFIHYVGPRTMDLDPERADFKGMPWQSHYISIEGKAHIEEGGYNTFPYSPSRYEQAPNEVYGRSPAMEVLPAIKTLNEQKKTYLKQGHRAVDPVLLIHDDGILDTLSLKPGSAVVGGVSKDGRSLVQTLPSGNIATSKEMMDVERAVINDNFLVTIFQILAETPQMTATEVLERTREKGILLAPTIGRQQSERLGPQIERELDVLAQQNLLPPMPPILKEAGAQFKVEYDSPLSRAQRAEEAAGLMRTVESVLNVANVTGNLAPLDHFNWDNIVPDLSDINAVPVRWRNGLKEIQALREGRAAQQQEQTMIQAAPSVAAVMKAQKA